MSDMWRDPIVEEVRAARRKLAAECGYDIDKLLARAREVGAAWPGGVVTKEALRRHHEGAPSPYAREK
jgi:hypothetical protein